MNPWRVRRTSQAVCAEVPRLADMQKLRSKGAHGDIT